MSEFYEVTSDQVREWHEACAEAAEKAAEQAQEKLEKIPADVRDACGRGMLEHYRREGEQARLLADGVAAGMFRVTQHDYLRIIQKDGQISLEEQPQATQRSY